MLENPSIIHHRRRAAVVSARSYPDIAVKKLMRGRAGIVIALLGTVLVVVLIACEVFPQQVVDLYWDAKRWASAAVHLKELPRRQRAYPRLALPYEDADGYAVLSAWITSSSREGGGSLVIQQEAGAGSPEPPPPVIERCLPGLVRAEFEEAFSDYMRQNAENWLLQPYIQWKGVRYTLAPAAALMPGWAGGTWNVPYDAWRANYVTFSIVGFDSHRSRAVLFATQTGESGISRAYYLFRRKGATWLKEYWYDCGSVFE